MTYFSKNVLRRIRQIINKNRIYAWMVIFIILTHVLSVAIKAEMVESRKDSISAREEFRIEIEKRQDALKELLRKDKNLAYNVGIIFIFGLCVLLAGVAFLASYVVDKIKGKETLPHTLDPPKALWSIGDVFKAVVFFIFFHKVFSVVVYILQSITVGDLTDLRFDMTVSTLIMDVMIFLFVLRVVKFRYKQGLDSLGLSFKDIVLNIRAGLYLYVAFLPILVVVLLGVLGLAKLFDYIPPRQPVHELIFKEQRPVVLLLISFLIALIGPFIEEVFFRGFLFGAFKRMAGTLWAILVSSFLFAFLHMSLLGFVPIMFLGILLAYLRERTGSLVPSVAVHVAHNSILAVTMFYMRELTSNVL